MAIVARHSGGVRSTDSMVIFHVRTCVYSYFRPGQGSIRRGACGACGACGVARQCITAPEPFMTCNAAVPCNGLPLQVVQPLHVTRGVISMLQEVGKRTNSRRVRCGVKDWCGVKD
jgi:hypothetical protein